MRFIDLLEVLDEGTKLYLDYRNPLTKKWEDVEGYVKWFKKGVSILWKVKSLTPLSETALSIRVDFI